MHGIAEEQCIQYYAWSNLTQEIVILRIYYESNLAQAHH